MLATMDLATVRRFTEDLDRRLQECDNGEGTFCSTLDAKIRFYVEQCAALRQAINDWARSVFKGETPFDANVESALKATATRLLRRAKQVAAQGRAMDGQCYVLSGLSELHCRVADLDFLLENWVSPKLAVSPAPRVKVPEAALRLSEDRVEKLTAPRTS